MADSSGEKNDADECVMLLWQAFLTYNMSLMTHFCVWTQYFWKLLPDKHDHGRLFARYRLAKLMTAVAHTDPYNNQEPPPTHEGEKSFLSPALSLVRWSPQHWQDLENMLVHTRNILTRKDADSLVGENDGEDQGRAVSDLYNQKVDSLIRYIRINNALASFRWILQDQLIDRDASVKIDSTLLAKFGYVMSVF